MQPGTGMTGQSPLIGAMHGIARSFREIQLLLLLVTALFYFVARTAIVSPMLWFGSLLLYGCTVLGCTILGGKILGGKILAGRFLPQRWIQPRRLLLFETLTMVAFIAMLIMQAGERAGPLGHLYLLPVVTAALLLGRKATAALLLLVLLGRLGTGLATAGTDVPLLALLISVFAEMVPALLVAFLTSALSRGLEQAAGTIRLQAGQDDLTGLHNLRSFSRLAETACQASARGEGPCALLVLDVDELARINDRFGHEAGDRALRAIADCIRRATRSSDLCGRYGGDEFVILLPRCGRPAAEVVANRIRHDVYAGSQDFDYAMRRLAVTIGIAVAPDDGRELKFLLQKAIRNLRREKQARQARSTEAAPVPGRLVR